MSETTTKFKLVFKKKTKNVKFSLKKEHKLDVNFGTQINVTTSKLPIYEGDYEVVPSAHNDIILETAEKRVIDDITVKKITKFETANPGGGYTLTIG